MTTIFCHYESSKLNFPTLVTGMQSKNNPFESERLRREASLFVERLKRPIFLLTWSRRCHAVSRCHDKQYKCHTLRWTNPAAILSGRGSLHSMIEHWDFLKCTSPRVLEWAALSMLSVFSLAMMDQMPRLRFSINLSHVPTWDASCLTPRLSQWPILGQMFAVFVCQVVPLTWYNRTPVSPALIHTNRVIQMANLISGSQPRSDPRRWYDSSRRICSRGENIVISCEWNLAQLRRYSYLLFRKNSKFWYIS